MATTRVGLDNPVFSGRLRAAGYERRAVGRVRPRLVQDVHTVPVTAKAQTAASNSPASVVGYRGTRRTVTHPQSRTTRSKVLRRSTVHAPVYRRKPRVKLSSKAAFLALAVILFLFGVGLGIDGLRTNKQVVAQVQSIQQKSAVAEASDTDGGSEDPPEVVIPDEAKKPDLSTYRVASDLPRALYIPRIDVQARVLRLGVNKDGAIASPPNIFDVGWYKESAKPGQPGAMLVDGHVHGPLEKGVFVDLKKLKPGDQIKMESGDGKTFTYSVVKTQTYHKDDVDMGAALSSATPGKPGLNLMTCTGNYDKEGNYEERLVVFAVQD